jgi:hypothetical protein
MGPEPGVRQQLAEPVLRLGRQSAEDVPQVGERVDVVVLSGADEGIRDRRRPAPTVTPEEHVFLSTDGLGTEHPLGEVIVDAQVAVLGVAAESRPVRRSWSARARSPGRATPRRTARTRLACGAGPRGASASPCATIFASVWCTRAPEASRRRRPVSQRRRGGVGRDRRSLAEGRTGDGEATRPGAPVARSAAATPGSSPPLADDLVAERQVVGQWYGGVAQAGIVRRPPISKRARGDRTTAIKMGFV